jgi:5'-nucleotidase (lipoprotein e(P4) family)
MPMPTFKQARIVVLCSACFAAGLVCGRRELARLGAEPSPPAAPPLPMDSRLASNVWLQTSGEYRACCLQVYQSATRRLEEILHSNKPSKPAVVMDLDETVLDNSAFQNALYKHKLEFSQQRWDLYEEKYTDEVGLIPGAQAFIQRAMLLGVTVVYITNRTEPYRKSTEQILARHSLGGEGTLLLREKGGPSDKSARREEIATRYNVLMYFGDNLRDFSDSFAEKKLTKSAPLEKQLESIRTRLAQVDAASCHWGVDWFVLPNPVYGEWDRDTLLGDDARARLRPTRIEFSK